MKFAVEWKPEGRRDLFGGSKHAGPDLTKYDLDHPGNSEMIIEANLLPGIL